MLLQFPKMTRSHLWCCTLIPDLLPFNYSFKGHQWLPSDQFNGRSISTRVTALFRWLSPSPVSLWHLLLLQTSEDIEQLGFQGKVNRTASPSFSLLFLPQSHSCSSAWTQLSEVVGDGDLHKWRSISSPVCQTAGWGCTGQSLATESLALEGE